MSIEICNTTFQNKITNLTEDDINKVFTPFLN